MACDRWHRRPTLATAGPPASAPHLQSPAPYIPGTTHMTPSQEQPTPIPLETQLETLAARGIALRPDRTIDDLLFSYPREEYEAEPYTLLLFMLGGEVEEQPWGRHFSDNVYGFDAECIEDTGDYKSKIKRLAKIAGPDLPLQSVTDEIDIIEGVAHIEFTLDGRTHDIEPTVDDDWFDPEVITHLAKLLAARPTERRFFAYDTGDQNLLIACLTPAQAEALEKDAGLTFHQLA